MRYVLAAVAAAVAATAFATPASACAIQYCWYTQPVCQTYVVDCSDLTPVWGCTDTIAGPVCVRDLRELVPVG